MRIDPVIAQVRENREKLCGRFENDPEKFFRFLQEFAADRERDKSLLYPKRTTENLKLRDKES
jgi:hypothetical protein